MVSIANVPLKYSIETTSDLSHVYTILSYL